MLCIAVENQCKGKAPQTNFRRVLDTACLTLSLVMQRHAERFVVHPAPKPNGGVSSEVFFDLPQASAETLWAACETVSGGGIVCLVLPPQLTLKLGLHFIKFEVDALFF